MTIICIFVEAFFADFLPFATQFCGVAFLISSIGASVWKDLEQVKIFQNKSLIVHLLPHKNQKNRGIASALVLLLGYGYASLKRLRLFLKMRRLN